MTSRITRNLNQGGGRPCIRGMRIRVRDILERQAALAYAAQELDHPVLVG